MNELRPQSWHWPEPESAEIQALDLTRRVLHARGFCELHQQAEFCNPELISVQDPFSFSDMIPACATLKLALLQQETIVVYGDYDADGLTASALMTTYLQALGADVVTIIPDRLSDGYGLSANMLPKIMEYSPGLVITVDCGVISELEIAELRRMKVNVIVTDHHQPSELLPPANAVLNAKVANSGYEFGGLSGVGTAYRLICAYDTFAGVEYTTNPYYLALVAIGTIADQMLLVDENRYFVQRGLEAVSQSNHSALVALRTYVGLAQGDKVLSEHISYKIAPLLNSGGRMGQQYAPLQLLLSQNQAEAERALDVLAVCNKKRRELEQAIFVEACQLIDSDPTQRESSVIVIAHNSWHRGVLGLLASRLVERYQKPVVVATRHGEDEFVGSGRSFSDFDLLGILQQSSAYTKELGGHKMAVGLTVNVVNWDSFAASVRNSFAIEPLNVEQHCKWSIDVAVNDDKPITWQDAATLVDLEPFGQGNNVPLFGFRGLKITSIEAKETSQTLILVLKTLKGTVYRCVGFRLAQLTSFLAEGQLVDIVAECKLNVWQGKSSVSLVLRDLRPADEPRELRQLQQQFNGLLKLPIIDENVGDSDNSCVVVPCNIPTAAWFSAFFHWLKQEMREVSIAISVIRLAQKWNNRHYDNIEPLACLLALSVFSDLGVIELQQDNDTVTCKISQPQEKLAFAEANTLRRWKEALR